MKKLLKLLFLLVVISVFTSCEEEEPCESKTTTYTYPDGSTTSIDGPCL